MTDFVPPLVRRLVDRFGLSPVAATPPGEQGLHDPGRTLGVWRGPAGLVDGYSFIEVLVEEFGLRPDPRYGEWPLVIEAFRVHDPKDNPPDEPDGFFQCVRVTYDEGVVCVALYWTKADAVADAGGGR